MTRSYSEDSEEDIRTLLSVAGPRRQPPADVEARVRAATMAVVETLPPPESEVASWWSLPRLSVAAMLVIGLSAGFFLIPRSAVPPAGVIAFTSGAYTVRGSDSSGDTLTAGAIIRTSASGRMLIDLGEQRSVRLDRNASMTLHDSSEIWLHRGRIYVDSNGGSGVTVVTENASIVDIGTQFEVSVDDESLVVATREGTVRIALGVEEFVSKAEPGQGETLKIDGLELVNRASTPTTGSRWAWTQLARPLFDVQGRSLREYLEWAAREEGKRLRFSTPLAAQQADLRTLHATGEVDAEADTVKRVLATSAFELVPGKEHEIIVALRSAG